MKFDAYPFIDKIWNLFVKNCGIRAVGDIDKFVNQELSSSAQNLTQNSLWENKLLKEYHQLTSSLTAPWQQQ